MKMSPEKKVPLAVGIAWMAIATLGAVNTASAATCDQLNELYRTQYYSNFKVSWPYTRFDCPSQTSSLVEAMYNLHSTTFNANSAGYTPNLYGWVTGLLTRMQFIPNPTPSWAVASTGQNGVISLHPAFFEQDLVWRTSTLIHEARHIQMDDPGHVTCDHGVHAGYVGGCDIALYTGDNWQGGGYNYGFRYLWWVRDAAHYTELDQALVRATLKGMVFNDFNGVTPEQVQQWGN